MMSRARLYRGLLAVLLCFGACSTEEGGGSETNWLKACDDTADCGSKYSCLCGVCTRTCVGDDQCSTEGGKAMCAAQPSKSGCASVAEQNVCLLACTTDSCSAGFACVGGACVPNDWNQDSSGGSAGNGGAGGLADAGGGGVSGLGGTSAGGAGGSSEPAAAGMAGLGGSEPCTPSTVRCSVQTGRREVCTASGTFEATDYVCTTSLTMNGNGDLTCAVKADGRFLCFHPESTDAKLLFSSDTATDVPRMKQLQLATAAPPRWTGITFDGVLASNTVTAACVGQPAQAFDLYSPEDACALTSSGELCCEVLTDSPSSALDVSASRSAVCVLNPSGIQCNGSALAGEFAQVFTYASMGCGLTADGSMQCPPGLPTLSGNFLEAAAANQHVCAITLGGEIRCVTSDEESQVLTGTYTHIAAGDLASCAIRSDGTTRCWDGMTFADLAVPADW